ncbi:alanine transaminase [uncultured Parasutterella sp.]|jgi:alanine-synthesizing transaminase|uniref:alanine transaminase n=1 Tax=uncultured Parasutterella sp. TaxID=1263098 RepID=UPI0025D217D7|nr:alanine transaminase [uncultured Parasutterella sp.]
MNNDFPRIKRLPPYVFNITNELKMAARHRGEDIIDLSMGNPDGDTPKHIVDKMIEVAQRPGTHGYSASRGIPRLRKAISDWYKRRWDVDIDPDKEAIVTIGSKEGIAHLMLATCDRGDTVLVPNPSYPIHIYGSIIAGADVRSVRMGPGIDFFSEFERAVTETTPKPKLMILGFPSNPTAQCVDLDFFEKLVALAKKHGVYIVHDLAYADIVYDGFKAPSIMQVPGAKDVAVEFFTMSKSYNMAGWRIGFMVGNRELVGALTRIKSYHDYGTFTPIQVGAIEALNGPQECVEEVRKEYEHRRDVMVKGLHDLGWMVEKPKASMYIWAELPEFYKSMGSVEFSKRLLEKAKVAVSPGIGFGEYGEGFVRIALIENADRIRQALRGIRQMFKEDGLIQPKTKKFHRRWKGEPVPAVPEKKPAVPKFAKVKNIPTKSTKKPKVKAVAKKK